MFLFLVIMKLVFKKKFKTYLADIFYSNFIIELDILIKLLLKILY